MKRETKIVVVKLTVAIVAGVAVAAVATAAIKNIVPVEGLTKYNKVMYKIGTIIISSIAANAGADYASNIVDSVVNTVNTIEVMKNSIQTENPVQS